MRVLHVLDHSIPIISGYSIRTIALLRGLQALGCETWQLTGARQGSSSLREEHVGDWSFDRTPPPNGVLAGVPVLEDIDYMGDLTYRIEQVVRRVKPQVLHAHSPVLNAIPALRVGHRLGIPVVYQCYGPWEDLAVSHGKARAHGIRYRVTRALETYALRRAAAVIVSGDAMHREGLSRGVAQSNLFIARDEVDGDAFAFRIQADSQLRRALGLEGAVVLGFIGTLQRHEGVALVLEAMRHFVAEDRPVKLLVVGDGDEYSSLRSLAASPSLSGRVVFVGRVHHEEVARYYALIDVMVYPAKAIRFTEIVQPYKMLEAMASGCLVVASDVGGHRELVIGGETGVMFRPDDARDLARTLQTVLKRPDAGRTMALAARRYVESRGCRSSADTSTQVYKRLLG